MYRKAYGTSGMQKARDCDVKPMSLWLPGRLFLLGLIHKAYAMAIGIEERGEIGGGALKWKISSILVHQLQQPK